MREATNWLPGQIVLAVAFVLAGVYVLVSMLRKSAPSAAGSDDDLSAKYNGLVAELREHVANRHLLPSDAWEKEKSRLEQAAVAVLRQREVEAKHQALKSEAREEKRSAVTSGGSTFKGILIGGGTVGFFALLWFLLTDAVKPRTDGMTVTGATPPGMPTGAEPGGLPPPDDSKLKALFEVVQKKPNDIEALADMSLHLMRRQGFEEAKPFVLRPASTRFTCVREWPERCSAPSRARWLTRKTSSSASGRAMARPTTRTSSPG